MVDPPATHEVCKFRDVNASVDTRLQFDEGEGIVEVAYASFDTFSHGIVRLLVLFPDIKHCQRNSSPLLVEPFHFDSNLVALGEPLSKILRLHERNVFFAHDSLEFLLQFDEHHIVLRPAIDCSFKPLPLLILSGDFPDPTDPQSTP